MLQLKYFNNSHSNFHSQVLIHAYTLRENRAGDKFTLEHLDL